MKTNVIRRFFVLALIFSIWRVQPAQAAVHGAYVIVQRAANFGNDLVVHLAIDGRGVANIARAHRYEEFVSGGQHTLTVTPLPNTQQHPPTSIRVRLRSGQAYFYTVGWDSKQLVLRRTTDFVPAAPAPPLRPARTKS